MPLSRRTFLEQASALAASTCLAPSLLWGTPTKPTGRVAAINSIYRLRSHAYHIAGRFLHGYAQLNDHGERVYPGMRLVRMYSDQFPADDLSRDVGRKYGVEISSTVAEALGGKGKLDVDAVLLVVEHGEYPVNEYGQIQYPRYELFQQIIDVFRTSGRSVPVFVDKHLSYDHRKSAEMVKTSRELRFGLMAGSSLPVTWRDPELDPALETPFTEGLVAFGFDRGPAEIYLFHALESLQCLLERRVGGETGVESVVGLERDAVWKAGDSGLWSWELLRAALARSPSCNYGDVREQVAKPQALLVTYRDGTRGAVLNLPEQTSDLTFAGKIKGRDKPLAISFVLPAPPGARYFDALVRNIEKLFATGKSPYPVERTLLTSTVLDLGLHSLKDGGQRVANDALDIRYQPPAESGFSRGSMKDEG
jgi:hypothetical protein